MATSTAGGRGDGTGRAGCRAILDALARCRGRIYGPAGAAAALGLKPTTLYGKMRKHHIARRDGDANGGDDRPR